MATTMSGLMGSTRTGGSIFCQDLSNLQLCRKFPGNLRDEVL